MLAFGLIIVQAILGGITVLFELPLAIAVTHAAHGAGVVLPDGVDRDFHQSALGLDAASSTKPPSRIPLAMLAVATTAIIYLQILVGALMRHMSAGLAIPDFPLVVRPGCAAVLERVHRG